MQEQAGRGLLDYAVARLYEEAGPGQIDCKICEQETESFDLVDFNKSCMDTLYPKGLIGVPVFYRKCRTCQFIFTTFFDRFTPDQWRLYVYNDGYADVDPEYAVARPQRNAVEIASLLVGKRKGVIALDFGGGNGRTAELLRRKGWVYDTYDPFGSSNMAKERIGRYNFCSAFEVFEHSPDPVSTLRNILELMSSGRLMILIGTGINDPAIPLNQRLSWWYAAPRNGHVSLHSRQSLQVLATRFGLEYASVSPGTHLLFRSLTRAEALRMLLRGKVLKRLQNLFSRA